MEGADEEHKTCSRAFRAIHCPEAPPVDHHQCAGNHESGAGHFPLGNPDESLFASKKKEGCKRENIPGISKKLERQTSTSFSACRPRRCVPRQPTWPEESRFRLFDGAGSLAGVPRKRGLQGTG